MGLIHGAIPGTIPGMIPQGKRKGREGKGREEPITHCMTSTTGSSQTRGLSDVSSCNATNSIEHLDFDPPCDTKRTDIHPAVEPPPATHTWVKGCCGIRRLSCQGCVTKILGWGIGRCPDCHVYLDGAAYLTNLKPLR